MIGDSTTTPDCLVIGSALWDIIGRADAGMDRGDDVPGRISRLPGGVALNVALGLARIGVQPGLLSYLGADPEGDLLMQLGTAEGVDMSRVLRGGFGRTDIYMAIEDPGGVVVALADALSLEQAGTALLSPYPEGFAGPVVVDGNLTATLLAQLCDDARLNGADLRLVPASPGKVQRLAPFLKRPGTTLYINRGEAETLADQRFASAQEAATALAGPARLIVTDGAAPAADCDVGDCVTCAPPFIKSPRIVTGAGDRFLAAHLAAEHGGADRAAALQAAVSAAAAFVTGGGP